jgi:hypothetical protein
VSYAGSFRIVCGIYCASSQFGPDSVCSLGPLSSKCSWCTLCHRLMYPLTNDATEYELTHSKCIDFVIPDSCLSTSVQVLTHLDNLAPCPDLKACPASSRLRQTPPPTFHAHIKDLEVTGSLYLQSETLWFLTPLDWSLASQKKSSFPYVLSLRLIRLSFHPGGRVGVRDSLNQANILLSSPSFMSY